MQKLEAVLFDLDGTLINSAPDIRQGVNQMLREEGRQPLSLEQVTSFIGDGAMPLCRRALEATGGMPTDDIYPYVQKYIKYRRLAKPDPAQIYPYAIETLDHLRKHGIKIGLCTNMNEGPATALLDGLNMLSYFSFIAGGDTFTVHKPHPGHILGALEAMAASPSGAIFVGDGPNDVIASERAGIPCIVVTHGYAMDIEELGPIPTIKGFEEFDNTLAVVGFEIRS